MDYTDLSIEDFTKVAYQTGGKTVNYSINDAGITILGPKDIICFSLCPKIKSRWTKDLNTVFYICVYICNIFNAMYKCI